MSEKKKTIKERIEEVYLKYVIKGHEHDESPDKQYFINDVFELIERASNPNGFCSECDSRMVYSQKCINCGHINDNQLPNNPARRPAAALPAGVEELLKGASGAPKGKTKAKSPAEKINELRNKAAGTDTSSADETILRAQDKNIKGEVNWC